jgi:chemotaxis protein methyltransferase WspC
MSGAPHWGARARTLLRAACGLDVSEAAAERAVRERLLERGAAPGADLQELAPAYLDQLNAAETAALIERVVVPESWFFRDPDAFAAAVGFIERRLAAAPGRPLRILSLPCAGGEEPYTMAMALMEAGVPAGACRIDALDLSTVALARARAGWFSRNAFRVGDLAFRERHFTASGNGYQISEALRGQVNFSQANILAIDTVANAGRYDVVFCRNLLIYFDAPTSAAAAAVLHALLADDGLLLAGYAEVPAFCANGFAPLRLPGAFALQKAGGKPAPRSRTPAEPARMPRPAARPVLDDTPPRAVRARAPAPAAKPPADPAALLALARRQADNGDYAAAAATCHRLLSAESAGAESPQAADAYYLLGLVADIEHQSGAADDYWRRCVYLRPDHYDALCRLALLAEQGGHASAAARLRQRAARVFQRRDGAPKGERS